MHVRGEDILVQLLSGAEGDASITAPNRELARLIVKTLLAAPVVPQMGPFLSLEPFGRCGEVETLRYGEEVAQPKRVRQACALANMPGQNTTTTST